MPNSNVRSPQPRSGATSSSKSAVQLDQDKDLDALRSREDFQKLRAALEPGQTKDP